MTPFPALSKILETKYGIGEIKSCEKVRVKLTHSQFDLATGSKWDEIIGVTQMIERSLKTSDAALEKSLALQSGGEAV